MSDSVARAPVTLAALRIEIDYSVEVVWPYIAAFGGLEKWVDGVTACSLEGTGPGAIRTVTLPGRVVRERLEAIDHAAHRIRYEILPPHSIPADNVFGDLSLLPIPGGRTALLWQAEAEGFDVAPAALANRIEAFYRASLAGLCRLLAQKPHYDGGGPA